MPKFKESVKETNPGLHLLYIKWAVPHLKLIDDCIKKFDETSNGNMLDITMACRREREKLVKNNEAYFEADEILKSIKPEEEA